MPVEKKSGEDVVTINLQRLAVPASIVFSSVVIGLCLLIGLNNIGAKLSGSALGTSDTPTDTGTGNVPSDPTTAITSIDNDAVKGNKDSAKVAIVEFTDFDCPFCGRHHTQTMTEIVKNYVDTGKAIYVIRDNPLDQLHPLASTKALAAECVKSITNDSAYFSYLDILFTNQGDGADQAKLAQFAQQVGADKSKFDSCYSSKQFEGEVSSDLAEGGRIGINGTPSFVVGLLNADGTVTGDIIVGAQPYSEFQRVIEAKLAL